MTDKVKEIAEKWSNTMIRYLDHVGSALTIEETTEFRGMVSEAITEATASQSAEIERLQGIIERAIGVMYDKKLFDDEILSSIHSILDEAKKGV